jgi:hypothetical protein
MTKDLSDALGKFYDALPPHLQEEFTRKLAKEVGSEQLAISISRLVMEEPEEFSSVVEELKTRAHMGTGLIERSDSFLGELRAQGKDFYQCWAAMTVMMQTAGPSKTAMAEMVAYMVTHHAFNGDVPPPPDAPANAAEEATQAPQAETLDLGKLADIMRDDDK